jgi:hypothetical protein
MPLPINTTAKIRNRTVITTERADAYANDQRLPGSEPGDPVHPLRHRRLLAGLWAAAELAQRGHQQQRSQRQLEDRDPFRRPRASGQVDRSGNGDEYRQHARDTDDESGNVAAGVGDRLLGEEQQDLGDDRYRRDRDRDGEGKDAPDDIRSIPLWSAPPSADASWPLAASHYGWATTMLVSGKHRHADAGIPPRG